jgi:hypothetical protein
MFSGPPLALPAEFPLRLLLSLAQNEKQVGAWVQGAGPLHRLTISADGRCICITIGQDLGQLLPCCARIVVRSGSVPVVLGAEALIHWRSLQVIVGAPYLPGPERLREIFPEAEIEPSGFRVSTELRSPEDVLSNCVRHGIPVMESRVVYRRR